MTNETIRRIPLFDKQLVVKFLNEHWGSAHPLVNNDVLFNYYYVDGDWTNFYVLEDEDGIASVCGYIKASQQEHSDIWISIWCAKKGKNGLGLTLMGEMQKLTGAKVMACNNIRKATMPFYTFLSYYPGQLSHYYRLRNLPEYRIAVAEEKVIPPCVINPQTALKEFSSFEEVQAEFKIPHGLKPAKDYWYINKRYFNYPHYSYRLFGLYQNGDCLALVIFRINESEEGKVLRLVDFIGKPCDFSLLNGYIDRLLEDNACEYCDMYCFGVNGEAAGFVKRNGDEVIIPNYLDPLWQKNIDYYFFTTDCDGFTMFKADGDQDRKNLG